MKMVEWCRDTHHSLQFFFDINSFQLVLRTKAKKHSFSAVSYFVVGLGAPSSSPPSLFLSLWWVLVLEAVEGTSFTQRFNLHAPSTLAYGHAKVQLFIPAGA
ncbi:hypothetical protein VNO80_05490 [Phaseolus coccineus]|uniref:Uncharacterized protein n=1 Tax=Phaseolus coccineus TaxID=3886 RepID=A0AAN9NFQ3_PHACN